MSIPSAQKKLDQASARFVKNVGQWPKQVLFLARAQNLNVWLSSRGITFDYYKSKSTVKNGGRKGQVMTMSFTGSSGFAPDGVNKLGFNNLYFKGNGQKEHEASNFAGVVAKNVYPGVDVHSYYDHQLPRYDLVVKPNADPSAIHLNFHGATKTSISDNRIVLSTQIGPLVQGKLFAYQNLGGKKRAVSAKFVSLGKNEFGFRLGGYDRTKELVIDPLVYGSYFGGDSSFDSVNCVTTDSAGTVYLTGYTMSTDFPIIDGPYGFNLIGIKNAFVAVLQGDAYNENYCAYVGGSISDNAQYITVDPFGDIWIAGRTTSCDFPGSTQLFNTMYLTCGNPTANQGQFYIQYGSGSYAGPLNYNASPADVQKALKNINLQATVTQIGAKSLPNGGTYQIQLPSSQPQMLSVFDEYSAFYPNPPGPPEVLSNYNISFPSLPVSSLYNIYKDSTIFAMRFQQSSTTVLDPHPGSETILFFGGNANQPPGTVAKSGGAETLAAFQIMPETNPLPTDPIVFAFGGTTYQGLHEIQGYNGTQCGYVAKYSYSNQTQSFTQDPAITRYIPGANGIDLTGVAIDSQGSVYTGGTIYYTGNWDTSSTAQGGQGAINGFATTPNVFQNGQLLRNNDLFIQKYTADGTTAYSAFIGGSESDGAGGEDYDEDGTIYTAGNSIAVDTNLDLYILGLSFSWDFPRTRGVYGEIFESNVLEMTVTKVNADASQLLYSTNLQTNGNPVYPSGISVDLRGDAFVTGNLHPWYYAFADSGNDNPTKAGNPNTPTSMPLGAIQVTTDALVKTLLQPDGGAHNGATGGPGDMATVKGFLNVLDPAADQLMYGTYLGGALDDRVFGPYVDAFGDVWVFGWVDNARAYELINNSIPPTVTSYYDLGATDGWLPTAMISPLAFKAAPENFVTTFMDNVWFGYMSTYFYNYPYEPWVYTQTTTVTGYPLPTIPVQYGMEGWLDKLRVGLASITSVTFTPTTVPGGLGATTTGTVTLTQAAPNGGASVVLTLLNNTTAASFSTTSQLDTLVIAIAAGGTNGTFTVYSNPVTGNTPVQVQAAYEGSYEIGLFTVTPWLQQLSLTPNSVVGGNSVTGKITLAALPPTGSGGVNVTVLTDSPSIVTFPGGGTVNVPEGQTSVDFTINTNGVAKISYPQVTASLLGIGLTEAMTVTLAGLEQLTFNPASVSGGSQSTATLSLNGQATGPFNVNLTSSNSSYTFSDPKTGKQITSLSFQTGDSAAQFLVNTPYTVANGDDLITCSSIAQGNYPPMSISGTLFVTAQNLTTFTINPTQVSGGGQSTGTVVINAAAPDGGVVVNLSSSNTGVATVPANVIIPSGATSATFTIQSNVIGSTSTVTISAQRGAVSITQVLTVEGVTFGFNLAPTSVVGGPSGVATGTLTLASAAPPAGLTFTITSDHPNDAYFGAQGNGSTTATIPGGGTTGTFTISTAMETSAVTANISANVFGGSSAQAQTQQLTISPVGVSTISFNPSTVRGTSVTICTVTLDAPAPAGGTLITLSESTPVLILNSGGYLVPAGSSTISFSVKTIKVSRNLSTTVTAVPPNGGQTASTLLIVTR